MDWSYKIHVSENSERFRSKDSIGRISWDDESPLEHKKPEPNDSGKPCSGDMNILHCISDGPRVGFNKEKPSAKSAIFLHFHLLLKVNLQEYPDEHFVWSGWTSGGCLTRKTELFHNSFFMP